MRESEREREREFSSKNKKARVIFVRPLLKNLHRNLTFERISRIILGENFENKTNFKILQF